LHIVFLHTIVGMGAGAVDGVRVARSISWVLPANGAEVYLKSARTFAGISSPLVSLLSTGVDDLITSESHHGPSPSTPISGFGWTTSM
jgi:hypothetical protein